MLETNKLYEDVKQLNNRLNQLNSDVQKLKIRSRAKNYKTSSYSDEVIKLGHTVYRVNNTVRIINHEICNPENDTQKSRDKIHQINDTIKMLREEIQNKLKMIWGNNYSS